jgi:hypothetical protein
MLPCVKLDPSSLDGFVSPRNTNQDGPESPYNLTYNSLNRKSSYSPKLSSSPQKSTIGNQQPSTGHHRPSTGKSKSVSVAQDLKSSLQSFSTILSETENILPLKARTPGLTASSIDCSANEMDKVIDMIQLDSRGEKIDEGRYVLVVGSFNCCAFFY